MSGDVLDKIKVVGLYPGQQDSSSIDDSIFLSNDLKDDPVVTPVTEETKENFDNISNIEDIFISSSEKSKSSKEDSTKIEDTDIFFESNEGESVSSDIETEEKPKEIKNTKEKSKTISKEKGEDNNNKSEGVIDGLESEGRKFCSYLELSKTLALGLVKNTKDKNITTNGLTKEDLEPIFTHIIMSITKENNETSIYSNLTRTLAKGIINNAKEAKVTTHGLTSTELEPIWEFIIKQIER